MRIKFTFILLMVFTMAGFSQENDVDKAREAIEDFKKVDAGITELFDNSYGYAVLPGIGKGGIGIGGAGGKGTVFKGGEPVADVKMSQVTIGFQLGGQKYAEVIFFEKPSSTRHRGIRCTSGVRCSRAPACFPSSSPATSFSALR